MTLIVIHDTEIHLTIVIHDLLGPQHNDSGGLANGFDIDTIKLSHLDTPSRSKPVFRNNATGVALRSKQVFHCRKG